MILRIERFSDFFSVEHAMALLISPTTMPLLDDTDPWPSHGVIDWLCIGLMYNSVENLLLLWSNDTSVSKNGNLLSSGISVVSGSKGSQKTLNVRNSHPSSCT